jgi:hypothetical protein
LAPGANLTISSYYAGVVKIYSATNSIENGCFLLWKRCSFFEKVIFRLILNKVSYEITRKTNFPRGKKVSENALVFLK